MQQHVLLDHVMMSVVVGWMGAHPLIRRQRDGVPGRRQVSAQLHGRGDERADCNRLLRRARVA